MAHAADTVTIWEELERDLPDSGPGPRSRVRLRGADLILEDRRGLEELRADLLSVMAGSAFLLQRLRPTPAARTADPAAVRYRARVVAASPTLAITWPAVVDLQHRVARRTHVCGAVEVLTPAG
jgi:hypothetical protein